MEVIVKGKTRYSLVAAHSHHFAVSIVVGNEEPQFGGTIAGVASGVTRSELRKVRAIVSLIGEENLPALTQKDYLLLRGLHVYAAKNEDGELSLSIWNERKENATSRCLFADKISLRAYTAALAYWKPRYPPPR